jgi:hypothetical protein
MTPLDGEGQPLPDPQNRSPAARARTNGANCKGAVAGANLPRNNCSLVFAQAARASLALRARMRR